MKEIESVSLFKITEKMRHIENELMTNGGEMTEDHEQLLADISTELTNKTDNVVSWINSLEAKIQLCENEIHTFVEIKTKIDKTLTKFKEYVVDCMDRIEKKELSGELRSIKIRKPSVKVEISNEDDIPLELINTVTKTVSNINKAEIKKILKSGQEVPGAKLINGTRSLIIK